MQRAEKLGVLGVSEGRSMLHGCDRSDLWETTRICDLDEDLCTRPTSEYKVGRYTLSNVDRLTDAEAEVIAIYTPDPMHTDHCIQALDAGKPVICTKPMIDDLAKEGCAWSPRWERWRSPWLVGGAVDVHTSLRGTDLKRLIEVAVPGLDCLMVRPVLG